jgi:hypothetical protein
MLQTFFMASEGSQLLSAANPVIALVGGAATQSVASFDPVTLVFKQLQDWIGVSPLGIYVTRAVATYMAAAMFTLQSRSALLREWTSAKGWSEKIIVFVLSAIADDQEALEKTTHGAVPIYKGQIILDWPDVTLLPLIDLNRQAITLAEWGRRFRTATDSLVGFLGFLTAFILHTGVTITVLAYDLGNLANTGYVPSYGSWLNWIVIWPVMVWLLQHALVPDWRERLECLETSAGKLSRQFKFAKCASGVNGDIKS